MIVLASNPKTMEFQNPDPDLETWIKLRSGSDPVCSKCAEL